MNEMELILIETKRINYLAKTKKMMGSLKNSIMFAKLKGYDVSDFIPFVDKINNSIPDVFSPDPDKIVEGNKVFCEAYYKGFYKAIDNCIFKDIANCWEKILSYISITMNGYLRYWDKLKREKERNLNKKMINDVSCQTTNNINKKHIYRVK